MERLLRYDVVLLPLKRSYRREESLRRFYLFIYIWIRKIDIINIDLC